MRSVRNLIITPKHEVLLTKKERAMYKRVAYTILIELEPNSFNVMDICETASDAKLIAIVGGVL